MIKFKVKAQVAAALMALALILSGSAAQAAAKNVILMISDGQGYNTIKATDYYTGNKGVYESWEVQYGVSTFSAGTASAPSSGYDPNKAWKNFGYVATPGTMTDSASAATALATGIKNYDGQLNWYTSQNPMTGKTLTEIAQKWAKLPAWSPR
jgi:alkaline phosphatase